MFTLAHIRHANLFVRLVAASVILTFSTFILSPTVMAAQADAKRQASQSQVRQTSAENQLSQLVVQTNEWYLKLQDQLAQQYDTAESLRQLGELQTQALGLDTQVSQQLDNEKQWLSDNNLSPKLMQRHDKQVKHYRKEMDSFLTYLQQVLDADTLNRLEVKLKQALKHLDKKQLKKSQQPFDPNNLPHKNLQKKNPPPPKTQPQQFIDAGLYNTPLTQVTALGDFKYDRLAGADNPAYLAAGDEIVLSEAIQAKAQELNYDPVKIYHYVLNTIDWQPTWGAMQDSDLTLSAQRGNAMDTASLLIALLRASQIPARYVHGTIDVPKERFNNWVGNFEDMNAGITYAASGGIPIASVTVNGIFTKVRMEHIWVEAAIDFIPSRGAKNKNADTWLSMDPSFKQYDYLTGLDVVQITQINPEQIAEDFINSGTVNETEGYVQGLNSEIISNLQAQVQTQLTAHIDSMDNPTVGDVIGGRKTIVKNHSVLSSGLSHAIQTTGARYDKLPSTLQHQLTIALSLADLNSGGGMTFPFAKLNNQQVTLSFAPASPEDEQALLSLLPDGEVTDISQLPTRISSSIHVIPELKFNGTTVLSGSSLALGEEIELSYKMTMPSYGSWVKHSPVVAGSYLAIATVGGNVSPLKLQTLQAKVKNTKAILESQDQTQLAALTREDILGDLFYAGALSYFAQFNALSHIMNLQSNSYASLLPSFGTYGYEPEVSYFFGLPKSIETGGIAMDLDSVTYTAVSGDGDPEKRLNTAFQMGILSSALEHAISEQMFFSTENPADTISAVKALQKASAAGQRIYHITPANQASILPNIHHNSLTMQEIRDALAAGKEVITHTDVVSVPGWSGAGYILFDPMTGSGAYKIGGGMNGSFDSPSATGVAVTLSVMGAGFEGYANSAINTLPDLSQIKQHKLGQVFKNVGRAVGLSAIAVSLGSIALNDQLTNSQKIAQFIVTIAGAMIANVVSGAIGVAFYPAAAFAVAMLFNLIFSLLLVEFLTIWFASIKRRFHFQILVALL